MAVLGLRTTPVRTNSPTMKKVLGHKAKSMGRKAKNNLPDRAVARVAATPNHPSCSYNSQARPELPNLYLRQRAQNHRDGTWTVARVIEKCNEPRSFVVETPIGSRLWRNRRHIRDILEPPKPKLQPDPPPVAMCSV